MNPLSKRLIQINNKNTVSSLAVKKKSIDSLSNNDGYINKDRIFSYCNWAKYIFLIGSRDYGKTFLMMDHFLYGFFHKPSVRRYWLRLTPTACDKLLANGAEKLIDKLLLKKYDIKDKITREGNDVFIGGKLFISVLPISTFYNSKGVAEFDPDVAYEIVCDEFQRESGEKNTFDLATAFFGQLENLIRHSPKVHIYLLGNKLSAVSDLLLMFRFIPHEPGIFKLKNKKRPPAVIINFPNSEKYLKRRKKSALDGLALNSAFTNEIENMYSLVTSIKLENIVKFIAFPNDTFVLWNNNIITRYKKKLKRETATNPIIPLLPYVSDFRYNQQTVKEFVDSYKLRHYVFKNLVTQKEFDNLMSYYFSPKK